MRTSSNPRKSERGQVLVGVIILLVLSAIILPSMLSYTFATHRSASIRQERMQLLYAADSGVEDALYWILNPGNLTLTKTGEGGSEVSFPEEAGPPVTYFLNNRNEADVQVDLTKNAGNGSYTIVSTATNNVNQNVAKIRVYALKGNMTVAQPPEIVPDEGWEILGNTTPGLASLGTCPAIIGGKNVIVGNIYTSGPLNIDASTTINGKVYSNGTLDIGKDSKIEDVAYANGDIILLDGAQIWGNAYAEGDITLNFGAEIWYSAYSRGAVWLKKESSIGQSVWAYGDITVFDPQKNQLTQIWGNASSNENIIVDGGWVMQNAAAGGTVSEINNGNVSGSIQQGVGDFTIHLPTMPTIVVPDVEYWRNYYYDEAHGNTTHPNALYESGPYTVDRNNEDVSLGPLHIQGDLDVANKATLTLNGTVYVDGSLNMQNGCSIKGQGKIVVEQDINLWNNTVGTESQLILLMSVYGDIMDKNNGGGKEGSDLNVVLYAPNGEVEVGVNTTIRGSIIGQCTDLKNMSSATYDEDVEDLPSVPKFGDMGPVPTTTTAPVPPELQFEGIRIISYIVLE